MVKENQFNFQARLQIFVDGGTLLLKYPDFEIHFTSDFSDEPTPSQTSIQIYNLSYKTRNKIKKGQGITLLGGFDGDLGVITKAKIKYIHPPVQDGGDAMFEIVCIEGDDYTKDKREFVEEKVTKSNQIQISFQKGVRARFVLQQLSNRANIPLQIVSLKNDKDYPNGFSASGRPVDAMQEVAEYTGSKLMYRRGSLIVRDTHQGFDTKFILDSAHGLISSPQREEDDDWTGFSVQSVFNYLFATASIINMNSWYVRGMFRVKSGTHTFDGVKAETQMEVEYQ